MDPLLVIYSKGWSYIQLAAKLWNEAVHKNFLINGEPAVPALADKKWALYEGVVETIVFLERRYPACLKYTLRAEFMYLAEKGVLQTELPGDTKVEYDDDESTTPFYSRKYYEPVMGPEPEPLHVAVPFFTVQRDVEPRIPDLPIVSTGPEYLRDYPEMQWAYPCMLPDTEVWPRVRKALLAEVALNKPRFKVNDYESLKVLEIDEAILLTWPETTKVDRSRFGARKARWVEERVTHRWAEVLKVRGPNAHSDYRAGYTPVTAVTGENLDDLKVKLVEYIESWVGLLRTPQHEYCPHCKGTGVRQIQK